MTLTEVLTLEYPYHNTIVLDVPRTISSGNHQTITHTTHMLKKYSIVFLGILPDSQIKLIPEAFTSFVSIIYACLNFDPTKRPSAAELVDRLKLLN